MSAPKAIAALAFAQGFGTTSRSMCPKCLGGGKEEESLSLTVDEAGGVHWICFRASCGYKGGPRGSRPVHAVARTVEPRIYTRPIHELSDEQNEALRKLYGTTFPESGIGYTRENDRFLLPVEGPSGHKRRGYLARSLSGDSPKSLSYVEARPFIHFAYPKQTARRFTAVVVEDWFSSEKVAEAGYIGISINGTHLNQEMVNEIRELGLATVIALDGDAFVKGLGYLLKYKEQFPIGLYAAKLLLDLKFEKTENIQEIVERAKGSHINSGSATESASL